MPRKARELGPLAVSRLTQPGLHMVGGVAGLALQVLPSGGRSWILRATIGNRRREMGLGGYPDVTLARAMEAAREARDAIRRGLDPIEAGRGARRALKEKPLVGMPSGLPQRPTSGPMKRAGRTQSIAASGPPPWISTPTRCSLSWMYRRSSRHTF